MIDLAQHPVALVTGGAVRIAAASPWTRQEFGRWLFEDYPRALLLTPWRWRRGALAGGGAAL